MKNTKKIILILIIVFILAILAILGNTARKYIILSKYVSKDKENSNSSNVYIKHSSGDDSSILSETYLKDNKCVERSGSGTIIYIENINKNLSYILYPVEENNGEKLAKVVTDDVNTMYTGAGTNMIVDTKSSWNRFKQAFESKLEVENLNGVKCYKVTIIPDVIYWIDYKTYNCIKIQNGSSSYLYEVKTNVVTDEDINISLDGYTEI